MPRTLEMNILPKNAVEIGCVDSQGRKPSCFVEIDSLKLEGR